MSKLNRNQINQMTAKIDNLLDLMEEAGEDKLVSLCLVYDHLMAARELMEAQDIELDRDQLERCFGLTGLTGA